MSFNALTTPVFQTDEWQCSAATLAWLLTSVGRPTTQDDAVAMLGPSRITPDQGLLDGSGSGLIDVLRSLGYGAHNARMGFDDVASTAGSAPIGIGGAAFYHWVGVRGREGDELLLANPAPGYKGVGQRMSRAQFDALGPFWAVVVDTAGGENVVNLVVTTVERNPWPWLLGGLAAAWALDLI